MAVTTQIKCQPRPKPSSVQTYTTIIDALLKHHEDKPYTKPRWSDRDAEVPVRNEKCWANFVNLSCCAFDTSQGFNKTATLITPSCAAMSAHYKLNVGDTASFVGQNGVVEERAVTKRKVHYLYRGRDSNYYPDMCIVGFDKPVDTNVITPAKLLPKGYGTYLPGDGNGLPCLRLDKQDHCTVGEVRAISSPTMCTVREPLDPVRVKYYENLVGGDSSDPCFLIGYAAPTLLTTWTFGGWGAGTSWNYPALQKWIDSTCKEFAGEKPERQETNTRKQVTCR